MARPPAPERATETVPRPAHSGAQSALYQLVQLPDARYEEMLAIPAEYALRALDGQSASLSRWERDRGLLRTVVNVGRLGARDVRFPQDETYQAAEDAPVTRVLHAVPMAYHLDDPELDDVRRALLRAAGNESSLSLPLTINGRVWGELRISRCDAGFGADQLADGETVAREVAGMVAVAERLQQMARMAFEDPLTGLGNRRILDEALGDLLASDGPGATVVMCDIDNLKEINDELGHAAGDQAIVATADALATAASQIPGSVAVRVGGDEFAILVRGAQRAAAISVIEAAARVLSNSAQPVQISCGVAVAPPGLAAREALAAADAAQYGAKARGAMLVVASDLQATPAQPGRRRMPRRVAGRPRPAAAPALGVLQVALDLADRLPDAPDTVGGRLRWLGEQVLAPLDLQEWALSHADLSGSRTLRVDSVGLRQMPIEAPGPYDLGIDHHYPLDDYPLSALAIERDGWFGIDVHDEAADAGEREVLHSMAMRHLVALGCRDGRDGWILELYGRSESLDVRVVGSVLSLAASALLYRPFVQLNRASPG